MFKKRVEGDFSQDLSKKTVDVYKYVDVVYPSEEVNEAGEPITVYRTKTVLKLVEEKNIYDEIQAAAVGCSVYDIIARVEAGMQDLDMSTNWQGADVSNVPKDVLEAQQVAKAAINTASNLVGEGTPYKDVNELLNDVANKAIENYINSQVQKSKEGEVNAQESQ